MTTGAHYDKHVVAEIAAKRLTTVISVDVATRRSEEVEQGSSLAVPAPGESPGAERGWDSKAGAMLLLCGTLLVVQAQAPPLA